MTITIDKAALDFLEDKEKAITINTNKGCG